MPTSLSSRETSVFPECAPTDTGPMAAGLHRPSARPSLDQSPVSGFKLRMTLAYSRGGRKKQGKSCFSRRFSTGPYEKFPPAAERVIAIPRKFHSACRSRPARAHQNRTRTIRPWPGH